MRSFWPQRWPGAPRRLPETLVGGDDQPVRLAGSEGFALPLVAILVLDATAFEVAALTTVEFLPFILFTLPAGVWVDRLPRRPILIVGDFGRAALLLHHPDRNVADVADARAALRRRLPRRDLSGLLRRRVPCRTSRRSSTATRSSRGTRSSRSAARPRRSVAPASGGCSWRFSPRPYAVFLDALSFLDLPACSSFGIRKEEPTARGREGRRSQAEHVDRAEGGPPFCPLQSEPARSGRVHGDLQPVLVASRSRSILVFAVRELDLSPGLIGRRLLGRSCPARSLAALTATRTLRRFGIGPTSIVVAALLWSY